MRPEHLGSATTTEKEKLEVVRMTELLTLSLDVLQLGAILPTVSLKEILLSE